MHRAISDGEKRESIEAATKQKERRKKMSVQDLIAKWEDALVQALQPTVWPEVSDEDLELSQVPLLRVKAGLRAGGETADITGCVGICD